jgi:murein DD-endopeptidase MepM/ murein hydrolase activator NlpD
VARAEPGRPVLTPNRRGLILSGLAASLAAPAFAEPGALRLTGRYQQGGFALGRTAPRANLFVDGASVGQASGQGLFVVGFDRDAAPTAALSVRTPEGEFARQLAITPGQYDIQRINGLPTDQVEPSDPVLLARIKAEAARKAKGFTSDVDADNFKDGFVLPVTGARLSAHFGGQRILNGVPSRPHYGSDLAAPLGTPVHAPAPGVVSFAETGLHFDGALVLLDHGQGLISCYLHLSRVDVKAGDTLTRGQLIGAVGMEGRATGPHLCWRMKWHGRNLDPMLMVGARAPA